MLQSRLALWLLPLAPLAALACSSASTSSAPSSQTTVWNCSTVGVPNGEAVACTSASALSTPDTYTCVTGNTDYPCPTDGGAPPDSGACVPTTGNTCYDDAGGPVGQGSGDAGYDQGGDGGTATGTGGSGDDGGSVNDYDSGGTGNGGGSGGGNGGSGGGNGGGNGSGGGTGNGCEHGNGKNPHCQNDAGAGQGGGSAGDDGGGYTSGPGSDNDGGTWTCENDGDAGVTCTGGPTCAPGSHPSQCGACVPDGCSEDCVPPTTGGCWVTGGGWIQDQGGTDSFGGNAMPMKSGTIRGEWEDVDHATGNKAHGEAQYLYCRHVPEPGPGVPNGPKHNFDMNQVYFGGPARWFTGGNWADGYWFDVMAEDHGEGKGKNAGGPDYYHFTIRQISGNGVSGAVIYDTENNMSGGNIQIHPPNNGHPYVSSSLPPWVQLQP